MSLPPANTTARSPSALEQHRDVAVAITYSSSPSRESVAAANGTSATTKRNSNGQQKVNKAVKAKTVVVRRPSTGNKNNLNGPTATSAALVSGGTSSKIPSSGRPSIAAALFAAVASSSVSAAMPPTSATSFGQEDDVDEDYDEDLPLSAIPSLRNTMAARVTLLPDEVATSARPSGRASYHTTHTRKSVKETGGNKNHDSTAAASSSDNNTGKSSHVPSWGYNNSRRHKQEMLTADRLPGMPARIKIYGAKNVLFDTCPGDRFYPAATFGRGALLMTQRRHVEIEVEADEPEKTLVGERIIGGNRDEDANEYNELIFGGSSNKTKSKKGSKSSMRLDASQSQHDVERGPNGRPLIKKRAIEKPMLLLPEADGGVKVEHGHTYHVVTLAANPHTEGIMTPQNLCEDLRLADLWKAVPSSTKPSMGGAAGEQGSESDDPSDNELEEGAGGRRSTVQKQRKDNADSSLMNAGECPTDAFWWKQAPKKRRGSAKLATTDASSLQVNSNNSGRASNRNLQ